MTTSSTFERDLDSWLAAEAPMTAPADLHDHVIDRAGRSRQRPGWLVAVRGDTFGAPAPAVGLLARPRSRAVVLVLLGLTLLGLLAALAVGAIRTEEPPLLGGNGPVTYTFQGTNHGPSGAFLAEADGSGAPRPAPAGCLQYSTDGSVVVVRNDEGLLVTDTIAGSTTIVPAERLDWNWHPHAGSFAVSPDGSRIAWLKARGLPEEARPVEIWISSVTDGAATMVRAAPLGPSSIYGPPVWSPDGRSIAYSVWASTDSDTVFRAGIDVVDVDSGAVRRVTTRPATNDPSISWSPDSRWITFDGLPDGMTVPEPPTSDQAPPAVPHDVFVVSADGTGEHDVSNSDTFEQQPAWSPDGQRLAYLSSDDGDSHRLTTLPIEGATPAGSPVTGPAFEFVVWSPDGTQLLWADSVHTAATTRQPTTNITTLRSIDRDFVGPSTDLATFDGSLSCAPAWQRVEP